MKNKFKEIVKYILIVIIAIVPFLYLSQVKADAGWDTDYNSGGGYSGGYTGGDYDSPSSVGDSGSGSYSIIGILGFGLVITVFAVIKLIYSTTCKVYEDVTDATEAMYMDISEDKLHKVLPDISLEEAKKLITDKYIEIQKSFIELNKNKINEMCTSFLAQMYTTFIDDLIEQNNTEIKNDFECLNIKIVGVKANKGTKEISAYVRITYYDYTVNNETQEIISGTQKDKIENSYILTFKIIDNKLILDKEKNLN